MDKKHYIENSVNELFKKSSLVLCFGGALIFLFLSVLDYVHTPQNFRIFLIYRIAIASVLLALFMIIYKIKFHSIIVYQLLIIMGTLASAITVELMILKTGGHASSYYVGMSLLGIWVISFLPVRFTLSLLLMLMIYSIYLIPILANETVADFRVFFTANVFLIVLLSSALILRHFHYRTLINELGLKYDLEMYKVQLENIVNDRNAQLAKIKTLSGMLPICASCKKIRDDKGYWNRIETYISKHSETEFSHGICPDCAKKLYPQHYKEKAEEKAE